MNALPKQQNESFATLTNINHNKVPSLMLPRRTLPVLVLAFFCYTWPARGHAILLSAVPVVHQLVDGPKVPFKLRFNSRVDGKRSRLVLVCPGGHTRTLTIAAQSAPDILTSEAAGLETGAYILRWQVLSEDGHITRGDVPFQVR
jgi:methionine-rich copper-binding protein CopC